VFAPDLCTGCEACRIACGNENGGGRDTGWRSVLTLNPERHPALPTRHLSLACNHCETPVCALGCPAAAYRRDESTGAVLLDPKLCIGCRYCAWLCPFDAPRYDSTAGTMSKCTFCAPRLAAGSSPACAAACPTGALSIGASNGRGEPDFPGLAPSGLGPALVILDPRRRRPAFPSRSGGPDPDPLVPQPSAMRKITLRSEWTLAVFTVLMPALVAWLGSGLLRPERAPAPLVFLGLAGLSLGVSTLHLGRPLHAWRALLNLRSSWLSREATLAGLFVGLAALWLLTASAGAGSAALVTGLALAGSMDAVYRAIPRRQPARWHSADAMLSLLLLLGIGTDTPLAAVSAAALKTALFMGRWHRGRLGIFPALGVLRLALLAAAASTLLPWNLALLAAVAGEAIDRCAFYVGLEPRTPGAGLAAFAAQAIRNGRSAT